MGFTQLVSDVKHIAERSKTYSQRHFTLFGLISVIAIPAMTFVERVVSSPTFDTLHIRVFAATVGAVLLFYPTLPQRIKAQFDSIWIMVITIILPFSFGLMLLMNAATTAPGSHLSPIWVYQYIVALFFFVQLIHHGPFAFVLWIAATSTVFGSLLIIPNPNISAIADAWIYPMPVYLTALIIGAFTNRNLHVVQAERLRAASAIGSNIAHELRTPLASIRSRARGVGKHLDDLVAGYEAAKAAGLDVPNISHRRIYELEAGLSAIQDEVEYSNTIINMLLINTSDKPISEWDFDIFSAAGCVEEAVARYPFNNSAEKRLLSVQVGEDFSIRAPRLMVVHVMFNLIKNGLHSVQRSGKGSVVIRLERSEGRNLINVKDTGAGIPANVLGQIFERFFTTIHFGQGAGIGLSFCRMVMQGIDGEIQCESEEKEYTLFRLYFPDVHASEDSSSDSQRGETDG